MESDTHIVRAILRQNEFLLRRHLVLSRSVLDQMKSSGLITDVLRRKILAEPAHQQVPLLLRSLENQGLHSLKKFLDVLKNTGHSWIVDIILDTDVTASGQTRTKDDTGYKTAMTRPLGRITDISRRSGYLSLRPDLRKSVTAGVLPSGGQRSNGLSLGALLKLREPAEPETTPRGVFNARTLLTDSISSGPEFGDQFRALPEFPPFGQQNTAYPRSNEDIPKTLYHLNQAFSEQEQRNQQALAILRQEEVAIRQLMEQNARDQGNIRRKQTAVHDIAERLRDIHSRARVIYEPTPNPNIGRYRLAQLNRIPWSIDG
ncbi:unnamed protein product [Candidula unifasciata]|uniref:CARD domain-containing protein n=1 Tax=Candidula unifasciata TaxID=100452 RepID=A0A8S3ZT64_9EUPU|nr:unnamed protein product [Candidula unifasciata]